MERGTGNQLTKQVALTGASGFIGSVIARHLHEAGHRVTALVRTTSRRDHIEPFVERFVEGEQAEERVWGSLVDGAECLIHNSVDWQALRAGALTRHLETNLMGSLKLLYAAAPRQIIFMSSIAVHHDMRPRWDGLVDEDHPTRPGSLYGAYKAAVEAHLWEMHARLDVAFCALRPCAVYGIDPRLERSIGYPIVERLRRDRRYEKPGGGKFVHVDDVAAATVAAITNSEAPAMVCNLADCYARWADLALMAAEVLGIDAAIDTGSPAAARNTFTRDASRALGVPLDRGHDGLRRHMSELIERMG